MHPFLLSVTIIRRLLDEGPVFQIIECLLKFLLGVHDNRTVPCHRFVQPAGTVEQKLRSLFSCFQQNTISFS